MVLAAANVACWLLMATAAVDAACWLLMATDADAACWRASHMIIYGYYCSCMFHECDAFGTVQSQLHHNALTCSVVAAAACFNNVMPVIQISHICIRLL